MNIIETLKAKAFHALCNCDTCLHQNDREIAISWYGEGVGILKALHALVGSCADTHNMDAMRERLENEIWPEQAL